MWGRWKFWVGWYLKCQNFDRNVNEATVKIPEGWEALNQNTFYVVGDYKYFLDQHTKLGLKKVVVQLSITSTFSCWESNLSFSPS